MLGAIAAWRRGSWFDTVFSPLLTFFRRFPISGWRCCAVCPGFYLRWFPLAGAYSLEPGLDFAALFLTAVDHAILPAVTIVISSMAGWMLGMRNAMLTTLAEDYVLMAKAKGFLSGA